MKALTDTFSFEYYEACSALAGGYRQLRESATAVAALGGVHGQTATLLRR
jgi:hypothetical protein